MVQKLHAWGKREGTWKWIYTILVPKSTSHSIIAAEFFIGSSFPHASGRIGIIVLARLSDYYQREVRCQSNNEGDRWCSSVGKRLRSRMVVASSHVRVL